MLTISDTSLLCTPLYRPVVSEYSVDRFFILRVVKNTPVFSVDNSIYSLFWLIKPWSYTVDSAASFKDSGYTAYRLRYPEAVPMHW